METLSDPSPVSLHLSLNVADLARSVEFYRKVFGSGPAKQGPDYAKFESQNPPLTLSLEPAGSVGQGGALNHVGFRLASTARLVDLQRRLEMAGLASEREEGVECCQSRQTKFWLRDPDQTLWEFYVLEAENQCMTKVGMTTNAGRPAAKSLLPTIPLAQPAAARSASAKTPTDWEHHVGTEFPAVLPFDDQSLSEIRLRGSFNCPIDGTTRAGLLAETFRVLVPGGRVVLHHLTGDRSFPNGPPSLPGPAAVVTEIPVDRELLSWLEEAGFEQIRLIKFAGKPYLEIEGVSLREMIVETRKPAEQDATDEVTVVYKGPFRELVDDEGHVFRRGEHVCISAAAWNAIRSGPLEESFVCLTPNAVAKTI